MPARSSAARVDKGQLVIRADHLADVVLPILHAMCSDEKTRPVLANLLIEIPAPTKRQPDPALTFVCCDNYRVAVATLPADAYERTGTLPAQLLIPRAIALDLAKLIAKPYAPAVAFAVTGSTANLTIGGLGHTWDLVTGYPNWRQAVADKPSLRRKPTLVLGVDSNYLADAAKLCKSTARRLGNAGPTLQIEVRKPVAADGAPEIIVLRPFGTTPRPLVEYLMPVRITTR